MISSRIRIRNVLSSLLSALAKPMASETDHNIRVEDPEKQRDWRLLKRLRQFVLRRAWYIHTPVVMMVQAPPALISSMLKTAARPSVTRLQHRNLFASGRRYYFHPMAAGFRMTTTHNRRWRYRKRTSSIVVMRGELEEMDENITRITLESRVNVGFLLDAFLIPVAMGALLIYTPWPPLIIALSIFALLTLSWISHRAYVVLEAEEMVWFTQKALEDLVPAEIQAIGAQSENVVYEQREFEEAWEKFYRQHRDES